MAVEALLGRALMDPATGLPNAPYFRMIHDWEARRARRRRYNVRVVNVSVAGGDECVRRSITWRLRRELRDSDLIASHGLGRYHILLTTPDAEHADRLCARLRELEAELNARLRTEQPLRLLAEIEPVVTEREWPAERGGRDD